MKQSLWQGFVVGLALTAALVAVSYLGWTAAGFPFAPFDLFDRLTRMMPGALVTFGIDAMIAVSRLLHLGSTGATAKIAEQTMAVTLTLLGGALVTAAAFGALRLSNEPAVLFGAILGVMGAVGAFAVANALNRIAPGRSVASGVWLGAIFLGWGLALGWARERTRARSESPTLTTGASSVGRRAFLVRFSGAMLATAFVSTVVAALVGRTRAASFATRWSDVHVPPNADAAVQAVPGTRPEFTALPDHYRVDIDTRPPVIEASFWRLRFRGLVEQPIDLTLDEVRLREPLHQFVTLSCISNVVGGDLIGTTRWTGVSVRRLLELARLDARATHLKIISADGFFELVALETVLKDPRVMLAYAWDDVPLPVEHGYPLRLYVPDCYGMKQPKWVETIEAVERWEPGYWVERGWDREGLVKATSAVDAVTVGASVPGGAQVAVGGIAHAGARGILKVDVQVDAGEWRAASLRDPMADTTWVVWRLDLVVPRGDHTFTVRCSDGAGAVQSGDLHTKRVRV